MCAEILAYWLKARIKQTAVAILLSLTSTIMIPLPSVSFFHPKEVQIVLPRILVDLASNRRSRSESHRENTIIGTVL